MDRVDEDDQGTMRDKVRAWIVTLRFVMRDDAVFKTPSPKGGL